jgi:2-keto-4-pentenoate hydratase
MEPVWEDLRVVRGMSQLLAGRSRRLAEGEKHRGWKAAMTSPEAMRRVGVDAPLIGYFMESTVMAPGSSIPVRGLTNSAAEAEVAVLMGAPLKGKVDYATARTAIAGVAPAIEIAAGSPELLNDLEALLVSDLFHYAMMFPGEFPYRPEEAASLLVRQVDASGTPTADGATPRDPVEIVAHISAYLAEFELSISAGDVVMSGSIVPATPLQQGDTVAFDFGPWGQIGVTGA